jgi:hypothetical protein
MARFLRRQPATVGSDPTANAVIQELKKYYNTKQPNANIIAPFKLDNFGNFDQAVWRYMVELRQQGIHDRLAKRINNAPNTKSLANLRQVVNNHSISNALKQSLRQRLSARQIALSQDLINQPLNGIQNLRVYRKNLANMWAGLSRNDKQALQEKYTRRIINVDSKISAMNAGRQNNSLNPNTMMRRNALVGSRNNLSNNNRAFLATLTNNRGAANRLRQNSGRRLLRQIPNNSNRNKSLEDIIQRINRIVASSGLAANNATVRKAKSRASSAKRGFMELY